MSSFEVGYCPLSEYENGEEERIRESSLCVGGLYTAMFLLQNNTPQPAAKYPARILSADRRTEGFTVDFILMNADMHPACKASTVLADGYHNGYRQQNSYIELAVDRTNPVIRGYFKEYGSGFGFDEELEIMLSQAADVQTAAQRERELAIA